MATPITKTIGELFSYSNGSSCAPVLDQLDISYPGWTEDTVIDLLSYCEIMRGVGYAGLINYSFYRALNTAQKKVFVNWALPLILSYCPSDYVRLASLTQLAADISDYFVSPDATKKAAMLANAKAIDPNTDQEIEVWVANTFKSVANSIARNTLSGDALNDFGTGLRRAGNRLQGIDPVVADGIILTKMEQIFGILD